LLPEPAKEIHEASDGHSCEAITGAFLDLSNLTLREFMGDIFPCLCAGCQAITKSHRTSGAFFRGNTVGRHPLYRDRLIGTARKSYRCYVEKGIPLGKRPELVGGGLIRSLGGWDEVKKMRLNGQNRIKGDQRILGESGFVAEVLSESERQFSRKYRLKGLGYDFEKVLEAVSAVFGLEKEYITGKGRQRARVMARDLLCYWTVAELGMAMVDLARQFGVTPAAVSCAVQRGEKMAKEREYQLGNRDI